MLCTITLTNIYRYINTCKERERETEQDIRVYLQRKREREKEVQEDPKDPSTMVPVPHYDKPLFIPFETG